MSNGDSSAHDSVMKRSENVDEYSIVVQGPEMSDKLSLNDVILKYYHKIGFQATQLGEAIDIVQEMQQPFTTDDGQLCERSKIYLGFTSNLMSSGLREIFTHLARSNLVDVIVSTAGGIEEDFIKCLAPTYVLQTCGIDDVRGAALRSRGLNRIGNLVVPNDNYCMFEDWLMPILDQMVLEQNRDGVKWSPSKIIHRLGKEIDHPESVYYWCYKNNIPVYCPAITDGSLGDMIYFHSYKQEPDSQLVIDLVQDIRALNSSTISAHKTGMIILGGGVVKHHICNANLMRNGADFAVYINTGQEFDGSDSGASPDEAVSWGKIKANSRSTKICADATLVFPILAALGFKDSADE